MSKAKQFKSKKFRVAVEGATTDGRTIQRSWIEDMAATYDPTKYAARVWMEHIRSMLPDSPFRAYGDVTSLSAEEITIDGETKLALFAEITPTNDLVNIVNNLKQKLYTSIEVAEKFANTGKAYLIGLGVTDSPASLGTSMLSFASQHPESNPLSDRKQAADNLFTAATETVIEFTEQAPATPSIVERVKSIFARQTAAVPDTDPNAEQFNALGEAVTEVAEQVRGQGDQYARLQGAHDTAVSDFAALREEFNALKQQLSSQPDPSQAHRPPSTGGRDSGALTDC